MQIPSTLVDIMGQFGVVGLVMILWYLDFRSIRSILDSYKSDMAEIRRMYEDNVALVRETQRIAEEQRKTAEEQHQTIVINIEAMQRLADNINTNQYCPMIRLEKKTGAING